MSVAGPLPPVSPALLGPHHRDRCSLNPLDARAAAAAAGAVAAGIVGAPLNGGICNLIPKTHNLLLCVKGDDGFPNGFQIS